MWKLSRLSGTASVFVAAAAAVQTWGKWFQVGDTWISPDDVRNILVFVGLCWQVGRWGKRVIDKVGNVAVLPERLNSLENDIRHEIRSHATEARVAIGGIADHLKRQDETLSEHTEILASLPYRYVAKKIKGNGAVRRAR